MNPLNFNATCPLPITQYPHVMIAHGGGGRLMHRLLEDVFGKAFSNPILDTRHDSAQFTVPVGAQASRLCESKHTGKMPVPLLEDC